MISARAPLCVCTCGCRHAALLTQHLQVHLVGAVVSQWPMTCPPPLMTLWTGTSTEPPASIGAANSAQMMLCEVPLSMSAAADARPYRMRSAMSGSEPPSVGEAVAGTSMCSHCHFRQGLGCRPLLLLRRCCVSAATLMRQQMRCNCIRRAVCGYPPCAQAPQII